MRWLRTFALLLLGLFLLLVAAPAFRWFQTRKTFVAAGPTEAELALAVANAPKLTLLPRIFPDTLALHGPIREYLAARKFMARMEPFRIEGTDLYDLRPYLSKAGMTIPANAHASWDPKTETVVLKLPPGDIEEARILVGPEFDEWKSLRLEVRASVVAVERAKSADFFSDRPNLNLEWLAGLPADSVRTIHSIAVVARSGQRALAVHGDREGSRDFVKIEVDPILGPDNLTIDLNFSFESRLSGAGKQPLQLHTVTQTTLWAGHGMVLEVGSSREPDQEHDVTFYLVIEVDRLSRLGARTRIGDDELEPFDP